MTPNSAVRSIRYLVKGQAFNMPIFDTRRDFTGRYKVRTRYHCTHSKISYPCPFHEAHRRYRCPRDIANNEHQLPESSMRSALCGSAGRDILVSHQAISH